VCYLCEATAQWTRALIELHLGFSTYDSWALEAFHPFRPRMPPRQLNTLTLTQLVLALTAVVAGLRASREVLRELTIFSIRVSSLVIFSTDQHTTRV
jgi:hypothetical protein